jgi:hypothetical protein
MVLSIEERVFISAQRLSERTVLSPGVSTAMLRNMSRDMKSRAIPVQLQFTQLFCLECILLTSISKTSKKQTNNIQETLEGTTYILIPIIRMQLLENTSVLAANK